MTISRPKMAENMNKVWQDVATLTESLQAKVLKANEEFSSLQKQLKESLEENSRLQVTINVLKKKSCSKCEKLIGCVEMLKEKLKERNDQIAVMGKFFQNQNPESYAAASQFVNEVITSSTADDSVFEESISCAEVSAKPTSKLQSPDKAAIPEPCEKGSPIIEKKSRNNKRKFLSISSLRKNQLSNAAPVPGIADPMKFDDDDFNETKLLNDTENRAKIAETCDNDPAASSPSPNMLASPEILTSMSQCNNSLDYGNENVSKDTPKFAFPRSRRSLNMNLVDADRPSSPEAKRKTPETTRRSRESKRSEPMDLDIVNAVERLPEVPVESGPKEVQPKTVWNLKRSREQLTNSKLKQTLLATTPLEKKVDISTSSEYKGGSAVQLNVLKSDAGKFLCKENVEETFFEPAVTSTHNDFDLPAQPNADKAGALAESTNKPRTPRKIDDSFDCLPSTSPKFKYQRDAIRKKSERWKLPGQECAKCMDFYEAKRAECSESQIRKLLNKCSRHRHKHPIQVYTPPGLWNPVFDDTDDELDVK